MHVATQVAAAPGRNAAARQRARRWRRSAGARLDSRRASLAALLHGVTVRAAAGVSGLVLHDVGAAAQVVAAPGKKGAAAAEGAALVEVGPRACLMPIRIFAGSFGGPVLYENPAYVSPNKARNHAMAHQPLWPQRTPLA